MLATFGLLVCVGAAVAVARGRDVRFVLLIAAVAMSGAADLAGARTGENLLAIVHAFFVNFTKESYLLPICCAMGFAYVLRHTGCDAELVKLLLKPVRKVRWLLVPGVILAGFLVNIPVISQTSTAVALGAVAVPLLRAARFPDAIIGSALLLGASLGGELLNPGAPEYGTVLAALKAQGLELTPQDCVRSTLPLVLTQLLVAGGLFWLGSARAEKSVRNDCADQVDSADSGAARIQVGQALVPLLPIVLLFLAGPPFSLLNVPAGWLVEGGKLGDSYNSRLIAAAMLVGVAAAALASGRKAAGFPKAFCEGTGFAFTQVITLIVTAACFAKAVGQIGLGELIQSLTTAVPKLLLGLAAYTSTAFAALSGSGIGATQGLFPLFADAARAGEIDRLRLGSLSALGAAAGRTMSPVAAVTLMCAALTGTNPLQLARRVALPLLIGLGAALALAAFRLN